MEEEEEEEGVVGSCLRESNILKVFGI